jgi:hypothetical protein
MKDEPFLMGRLFMKIVGTFHPAFVLFHAEDQYSKVANSRSKTKQKPAAMLLLIT